MEGSEVTLRCKINGEPDPQVMWLKDGHRIKTTRHLKLSFTEDGWCYLTIHSCTLSDTGLYMCTGTNEVGVQNTQCTLVVTPADALATVEGRKPAEKKRAPKFVKTPADQEEFLEGQTVELACKVIANPKAKLTWLKNQEAIKATGRYRIDKKEEAGEIKLIINKITSADSGTYTCVAENSEGRRECAVFTLVRRKSFYRSLKARFLTWVTLQVNQN